MGYMLIAPEYVIIWAGRQWHAARDIANKHKDRGWTSRTHGFCFDGWLHALRKFCYDRNYQSKDLKNSSQKGRFIGRVSQKGIEDRSNSPVPVYLLSSKREAGTQTTASDYAGNSDHSLPSILSDSSYAPKLPVSSDNKKLSHQISDTKEIEPTHLERNFFTSFQHPFKAFAHYCAKIVFHFFSRIGDMNVCTTIHGSLALSVPTFYAPSCGIPTITMDNRSALIGGIIGTIFDGTNCIPSDFPTVEETMES